MHFVYQGFLTCSLTTVDTISVHISSILRYVPNHVRMFPCLFRLHCASILRVLSSFRYCNSDRQFKIQIVRFDKRRKFHIYMKHTSPVRRKKYILEYQSDSFRKRYILIRQSKENIFLLKCYIII